MAELSIVAIFDSEQRASAEATQLRDLFVAHTEQATESGEYVTPSVQSFAQRFGKKWRKPLRWGDEGLEDNLPSVASVGPALFVFHDYWQSSPDLEALLKAAGAKVRTVEGPPVLRVALTFRSDAAGEKLRTDLEALFAQREEAHLCDWEQPAWSDGQFLGDTDDVWRVFEARGCTFTFPVSPQDLAGFTHFLRSGAESLELAHASARDVAALKKRELAAIPKEPVVVPVVAAVGPIPQTMPRVALVAKAKQGTDQFCPHNFASNGKQLFSVGFSKLAVFDPKPSSAQIRDVDACGEGLCVHEDTLWVCGYRGVKRSTDAGASFVDLEVPDHKEGAPMLYAIARDDQGVLWVGGYGGRILSCSDGKKFVIGKGIGRGTVRRMIDTPLGVLVLDYDGQIGILARGKLRKAPVRERLGLQDACVTPAGTIVAVGGRHGQSVVLRSTDGGVSFGIGKAPAVALQAVTCLPDGRLIAAGATEVLVSLDDGESFVRLDYTGSASDRSFAAAVIHAGSAYVGGPWQDLVRVD